jgi:hypothetical protein
VSIVLYRLLYVSIVLYRLLYVSIVLYRLLYVSIVLYRLLYVSIVLYRLLYVSIVLYSWDRASLDIRLYISQRDASNIQSLLQLVLYMFRACLPIFRSIGNVCVFCSVYSNYSTCSAVWCCLRISGYWEVPYG